MAVILQLLRELLSPELILDDPRPPTPVHVGLACQQTLPIVGVDNLYNKQTKLSTLHLHLPSANLEFQTGGPTVHYEHILRARPSTECPTQKSFEGCWKVILYHDSSHS